MKMEKNNLYMIIAAAVVVVIFSAGAWYYLSTTGKTTGNTDNGGVVVDKCGKIVADGGVTSGKSPFSPVLRYKLESVQDPKTPICEWAVDGTVTHTSVPVDGSCVFGGKKLMTPGDRKISLKVKDDTACAVDLTVTVQ